MIVIIKHMASNRCTVYMASNRCTVYMASNRCTVYALSIWQAIDAVYALSTWQAIDALSTHTQQNGYSTGWDCSILEQFQVFLCTDAFEIIQGYSSIT